MSPYGISGEEEECFLLVWNYIPGFPKSSPERSIVRVSVEQKAKPVSRALIPCHSWVQVNIRPDTVHESIAWGSTWPWFPWESTGSRRERAPQSRSQKRETTGRSKRMNFFVQGIRYPKSFLACSGNAQAGNDLCSQV